MSSLGEIYMTCGIFVTRFEFVIVILSSAFLSESKLPGLNNTLSTA